MGREGGRVLLAFKGRGQRCYKYMKIYKTAPKTKKYPAQDINSAEVENP